MNQLFANLLQQAARKAPVGFKETVKRVAPVARDLTSPQTYQGLAARAESALRRGLPSQFSGANFGQIPTQAIGLINQVADMPQGIARSVQSGMASRAIREMAGDVARVPASIQQAASGALRAPAIGEAVSTGRNVMTGLTGGLVSPTGFGDPFARDPGLRREFLKQFGGTSQKAADALARSGVNTSAVGGMMRNLGSISSTFNAIPGPTWAKQLGAGVLGGGASIGGSLANLAFLEGSSPQSADPYDRWQQLGYGSKEDMMQRVSRQAQIENADKASGSERFGPFVPDRLKSAAGGVPPGATPPSAPELPAPTGGYTVSSFGGQQAGQQTPPAPTLPTGPGVVSNGAGVPAQRQNVQARALSQEVLNAAQQYAAPAGVPLSAFYEGQQQLGRSMEQTGELQRQLKELGGATGMSNQALMSWAKANPGLAYRELQKLKGRSAQ